MCDCDLQSNNLTYQTNENCTYNISPTQLELCCYLTKHLEVEGRIIVCLSGLFFNTYAIFLFSDKKLLSELFNRLLLCLVIIDSVYLSIGILEVWFYSFEKPSFTKLYLYFFFVYPFRGIMLCCIIYMTVTLAFQRYKSIAKPMANIMRNPVLNGETWTDVMKYVFPVLLFSILFKLPLFFEVEPKNYLPGQNRTATPIGTMEHWHNGTHNISTTLVISNMRESRLYVSIYMNIANLVVTGILPVVVLIYFNFKVIKEMRTFAERRNTRRRSSLHVNEHLQAKEKRNKRTQTFILYAVVINFLICHILRIVLNIEDLVIHSTTFTDLEEKCQYGHPFWYFISSPISEILLKFNSSVNFFIYCAFNRNFRGSIKDHLKYVGRLCGSLKCRQNSQGITNSRLVENDTIPMAKTNLHSPHSPNDFTQVTKTSPFAESRLVPIDKRSLGSSYNSIVGSSDRNNTTKQLPDNISSP